MLMICSSLENKEQIQEFATKNTKRIFCEDPTQASRTIWVVSFHMNKVKNKRMGWGQPLYNQEFGATILVREQ